MKCVLLLLFNKESILAYATANTNNIHSEVQDVALQSCYTPLHNINSIVQAQPEFFHTIPVLTTISPISTTLKLTAFTLDSIAPVKSPECVNHRFVNVTLTRIVVGSLQEYTICAL